MSLYIPIIIFFIMIIGMASYLFAAEQITENAYRNISNAVSQTGNYLDNRLSDALEQMVALSNDPDILTIVIKDYGKIGPEDYIRVHRHIVWIQSFYKSLIDSIYINFYSGKFVLSRNMDSYHLPDISYREYRKLYQGNPYDIYWQNIHNDQWEDRRHIIRMFKLFGKEHAKTSGIIVFNFRCDFFAKVLKNSAPSKNGYLLLVSRDGPMIFKKVDSQYTITPEVLAYLQNTANREGKLEFQKPQGEKMIVIYNTLQTNQWKIAAVFPRREILANVVYIKFITVTVMILLILVAIMLSNVLAGYITKPISVLVENMKRIQGGNLHFVSHIHPLNEVGVLNQGVEDLVGRIKILLDRINKEQEIKRQLEFSIMQTQIHPHFLYNTLYSIKGLCDMNLTAEASAMVTALANFFRISVSRGNEIITVEEEVDHIRNYLFIQEMRYGDNFSYEIQVEPVVLSCKIIKLTLQPLVENAIYHGVKQKRGIGRIQVKGYLEGRFLCFEIRDNGIGMTEERLREVRQALTASGAGMQTLGVGVRSTHERLQLHYGPAAGLEIESELHQGTVVKVKIPLHTGEGEQNVQSGDCG
ncbi:sensor histidine kinase [Lucifera butyrica]|uniref:sensor histidine kinase n=1 Tax=Lucifera butyrica TaxID=1351585 RepID=UPI001A9DC7D6|nr:sensor histidine kinase [Lucifera butyrica]